MNYWQECVKEAFDDAEITATEWQIFCVVSWVLGAHENHGTATGNECIPNPLVERINDLERELRQERDLSACPVCKGKGWLVSYGPVHSSESDCYKCHGRGKGQEF